MASYPLSGVTVNVAANEIGGLPCAAVSNVVTVVEPCAGTTVPSARRIVHADGVIVRPHRRANSVSMNSVDAPLSIISVAELAPIEPATLNRLTGPDRTPFMLSSVAGMVVATTDEGGAPSVVATVVVAVGAAVAAADDDANAAAVANDGDDATADATIGCCDDAVAAAAAICSVSVAMASCSSCSMSVVVAGAAAGGVEVAAAAEFVVADTAASDADADASTGEGADRSPRVVGVDDGGSSDVCNDVVASDASDDDDASGAIGAMRSARQERSGR